jgi:soluble cytochrome b562
MTEDNKYSGEPWQFTPGILKILIDERQARVVDRFESMNQKIDAALASSEKAISKAESATEERFKGVNEFRAALSDQTQTFLSRMEYQTGHQALIDKIESVEKRLAAQQLQISEAAVREAAKVKGVTMILSVVGGSIGFIGAVAALGTVLLRLKGVQ